MAINNSLHSTDDLDQKTLFNLMIVANFFLPDLLSGNFENFPPPLKGKVIVNFFCENSTRTRISFEIAATHLGAKVINFPMEESSLAKGETLLETIRTIGAMKPSAIIIRHQAKGFSKMAQAVLQKIAPKCVIINAGEGTGEHPTQALLDLFTLLQTFGDLSASTPADMFLPLRNKTISIIGDIDRSRVARSANKLLSRLGMKVVFCGLTEETEKEFPSQTELWLSDALKCADALMLLRVQKERFTSDTSYDEEAYKKAFQVTSKRLTENNLSLNIPILHPGPFNYIELSTVIPTLSNFMAETQVTNGVAVRMALLQYLLWD